MVALSESYIPKISDLENQLLVNWPDPPHFTKFKEMHETIGFEVGPAVGAVGLIREPIPEGEIQAANKPAITWPDAGERMAVQKAHLICTIAGQVEKQTAAFLLTKIVAAVCVVAPAVEVYWGAATVVHSPEVFVAQAREMTEEVLPLYLWIQFAVSVREEKTTLRTHGMASLGFMEMEIVESSHPPVEVVGFAFNICHYLLDNGPILGDGQTIGMSATQKVPVRHTESILNPNERVYRLEY